MGGSGYVLLALCPELVGLFCEISPFKPDFFFFVIFQEKANDTVLSDLLRLGPSLSFFTISESVKTED